jgi:uncharacterized protein
MELIFVNGFNWDIHNIDKNWNKHLVHYSECEEVFFNNPLLISIDNKHSKEETRFYALGKTNQDRKLFVVFTLRNEQIRVISARDMNKRERDIYEKDTSFSE